MRNRRYIFANSKARAATALFVLIGLCASMLPIPLGRILRQTKDVSQPFPCQHCACGCKSAEQCWTACCCYTPAQKAAWAKEHGVTPPDYAVFDEGPTAVVSRKATSTGSFSAQQSPTQKTDLTGNTHSCLRCTTAKPKACCATKDSTTKSYDAKKSCDASKSCDTGEAESESVVVLSIMAYKCKGQGSVFSLLPWAIVETQPITALAWELSGWQIPAAAEHPIRVFLIPDLPPPRGGC